ncbi:Septin-2 [Ataeniobius toweri]|uniref:Septin-2 n=1 Tax=Ataeniobius toweri TaxID=208326 RepID=A0ABU7ACP9_9TELE|nr:Septin-2 [Ataeniobius toweri]
MRPKWNFLAHMKNTVAAENWGVGLSSSRKTTYIQPEVNPLKGAGSWSATLRQSTIGLLPILDEIAEHGIRIYQLPDADSDEDEEFKEQTRVLKASIPFAVIGSNQLIEVKGKKIRGRLYPWGVVEVENPEHNDFLKLRTMLVTHMQDLQEVTQDLHYENFRSERLKRAGRSVDEEVVDKDQILLQKELELRRMQEMLAQMQAQMKMKSDQ